MDWKDLNLPAEIVELLEQAPGVNFATDVAQLRDLAVRDRGPDGFHDVSFDVPGKGSVTEARVCKVRNGIAANYLEAYMRRRDPNCMVIGDDLPTDKARYQDRFGKSFEGVRSETFDWLRQQELAVLCFSAGPRGAGADGIAVCPANSGFFALGLAMLQGILSEADLKEGFDPKAVIYVAPPFRHTHYDGKQVVVHNRRPGMHEVFGYNLYPGPSAKKGVYGMLLTIGEREDWVTTHCSTVQVETPYDSIVTMMHEGASGGGKSEMLEQAHRQSDGRLLLARNIVTGDARHLTLPRACQLHPVTDDMAVCHPTMQDPESKKLTVFDAEDGWFLRVNHIEQYGTDPHLEALTVTPKEPLLFLNIEAVPDATALIWDHVQDEPGVPCPNPRVVVPRATVPNVVSKPVSIDVRSFGVRCPPCTAESPTYGIIGLVHLLPPALAWLWRLAAPRGHANPSIVDTGGMTSEGVGSYWPFATGRRVDQANLLLEQVLSTPDTLFVLCPNQHVGAWQTGFMPQWVAREYLARRGSAAFRDNQVTPARCSLLGYALQSMQIEGTHIKEGLLQVDRQKEVGPEAYDVGAGILRDFFAEQVKLFLHDDLDPRGRKIIDACLSGASVEEYEALGPLRPGARRSTPPASATKAAE